MALWTLIQRIAIYPVQSAIFDALQILNSKAWGTKQKKFRPSELMWLFIVSFPQALEPSYNLNVLKMAYSLSILSTARP